MRGFLIIMEEEKIIVRDLEEIIMANKQKLQLKGQFAKKVIDFLNSRSAQELKEFGIEDKTKHIMEMNKMIVNNSYRKATEKKLIEVKVVMKFNVIFDKRTSAGLPSCWDQQGNLLSWELYETLLVEARSKISSTHEKTAVLKGATIVNYLHKEFQLLWMMKTLFIEKPRYERVTNFRIAHVKFINCPSTNADIWRKSKEWMSPQANTTEAEPSTTRNHKFFNDEVLYFLIVFIF